MNKSEYHFQVGISNLLITKETFTNNRSEYNEIRTGLHN